MVDKIEMSLDEIIKANRTNKTTRSRGAGGARRGFGNRTNATGNRKTAVKKSGVVLKGRGRGGGIQKSKFARGDVNSAWKHDMFDGPKRGGALRGSDSSKLLVSNLDFGVSDTDIHELFAEFGPLKKAAVHYDRSGRSLGTADVIFERLSDAYKAIKQYNGVPLDGRPMNIQLATSDVPVLTRGRLGNGVTAVRRRQASAPKQGAANSRRGTAFNRRRGGGGGPAASGGRRGKGVAPTAEELDAELDAYVNDIKI
ncbi:THO complex subunit 4 [Teleopsis dalmanni]|uniref:THO complex subunit 4 n=1 Tax=Teleopsis dalmanni TaxID=139649 RepID=UPI000D32AE08|nr:THO complex subunit 4 [Teleopsis dalmanni]